MDFITDVARGTWLVSRVGQWAAVGGVAGTGFEAYARILHPVDASREDLTVTDEWGTHPIVAEATWRWADVAERVRRRMHPLVQWTSLTGEATPGLVSFDDGWTAHPPDDGRFDPRQLAMVAEHLRSATATPDDLVAAVWDGWGDLDDGAPSIELTWTGPEEPTEQDIAAMQQRALELSIQHRRTPSQRGRTRVPRFEWPGRSFLLVPATLQGLADGEGLEPTGVGGPFGNGRTPQMLWPDDHAWILASEIDWDSTVVGGSQALVDAIVADERLEAYTVTEHDSLAWDGDTVNPPPATAASTA